MKLLQNKYEKHFKLIFANKKHLSRLRYIIMVLLLIGSNLMVSAQDSTSSDVLFLMARKAAFEENNYPKAKLLCKKALDKAPDYNDIKLFLGRLYSWDKNLDSARITFAHLLADHPDFLEASVTYADLEAHNDNNKQSLKLIDDALKFHPDSKELLIRKAKILNASGNTKEALIVIQQIIALDNGNKDANTLRQNILSSAAPNKISVNYDFVHFNNNTQPWSLANIDYSRKTGLGSVTGRINYANRFGKNGFQFEAEAYPHLSKIFYAYLNAGYSNNNVVFPQWRGGFSLYANLPLGFESELGWRYLYFSSPTNIYTAYLGKYFKNYLLGVRTYLTPGAIAISQSYSAIARYYPGSGDQYIGLSIGTGISPDDRAMNQQLSYQTQVKTFKLAADGRLKLGTFSSLLFDASIINQKSIDKGNDHQIQVGLGYQRRF